MSVPPQDDIENIGRLCIYALERDIPLLGQAYLTWGRPTDACVTTTVAKPPPRVDGGNPHPSRIIWTTKRTAIKIIFIVLILIVYTHFENDLVDEHG